MKKVFAIVSLAVVAVAAVVVTAAPVAKADPIEDATPACVVYKSHQTVPVSGECEAYYAPDGTKVFGYTSVNQ